MQAVIPAAGRGTRLGSLTDDKPKPLVEVAGKPLLTRCLERLVTAGATELIVVVGYRGDQIVRRYGDSFDGVPVSYARQGSPEGMAHALSAARDRVDGPFMVMDGDSVVRAEIERCVERQREAEVVGTTLLERVSQTKAREKALCRTNDRNEIVSIENKPDDPPSECRVASSFHTFTPAVFRACDLLGRSPRGEYELSDAMGVLVRARRTLVGVDCNGWVLNVNTPAERDEAERRLRGSE
ncbi:nucleotidyltransferase family protein [Halegenticoccus tardaugens]|uniref:nucleotidyltransferase family protein n=1 Tax=Halegenticoccus tardaugens TaxID=2071624 RepID=UPI00100AD365|nr:sugar phosphate nucleotidyltransferase [Halegenticoccus tardaugens]